MRPDGHHEQVPQRADGGLARNGLPRRHRDRQRQEQRQRDDQRREGHEEPVAGDLADEGRAVAVARRAATAALPSLRRIATAMRTGAQASAASRAWLRRRPKTSRSSERSSRVDTARRAAPRVPASGPGPAMRPGPARPHWSTSKPSPVSETNTSSRSGRSTASSRTPAPASTNSRVHQLRRGLADRGPAPPGLALGRGQAQPLEHPRPPPAVVRACDDAPGPACGAPAASASVPCATRRPAAHHGDVRADLLDLGQQVARRRRRWCPRRRAPATRVRTSRVPCGSRPFVGSSRTSSSRGRSRAAARPSRWRMPSE